MLGSPDRTVKQPFGSLVRIAERRSAGLDCEQPAVDGESRTGHERCRIRRKKQHPLGDLFGTGEAIERVDRGEASELRLRVRRDHGLPTKHGRVRPAGKHGIDTDIVWSPLESERTGERPSLPSSCETVMTLELLSPGGEIGAHDVGERDGWCCPAPRSRVDTLSL